jgi:hypothetical protein
VPRVPAPVVAQVSRSSKHSAAPPVAAWLRGRSLDESGAHQAGSLLGKSRTTDLADAAVVALAIARSADIVTSDRKDIERLLSVARSRLRVVDT